MKLIVLVALTGLLIPISQPKFLREVSQGESKSEHDQVEVKTKFKKTPVLSGVLLPGKPIFIPVRSGPR